MSIFIGLIFIGLIGYLVGYPLIKPELAEETVGLPGGNRARLYKEAVMTTLNEIEFDYKMKKLSEEDYQALKNKYKNLALSIIKEEEDKKNVLGNKKINRDELLKEIEREIEEEVGGKIEKTV